MQRPVTTPVRAAVLVALAATMLAGCTGSPGKSATMTPPLSSPTSTPTATSAQVAAIVTRYSTTLAAWRRQEQTLLTRGAGFANSMNITDDETASQTRRLRASCASLHAAQQQASLLPHLPPVATTDPRYTTAQARAAANERAVTQIRTSVAQMVRFCDFYDAGVAANNAAAPLYFAWARRFTYTGVVYVHGERFTCSDSGGCTTPDPALTPAMRAGYSRYVVALDRVRALIEATKPAFPGSYVALWATDQAYWQQYMANQRYYAKVVGDEAKQSAASAQFTRLNKLQLARVNRVLARGTLPAAVVKQYHRLPNAGAHGLAFFGQAEMRLAGAAAAKALATVRA